MTTPSRDQTEGNPAFRWGPGRLWSLWEIMQTVDFKDLLDGIAWQATLCQAWSSRRAPDQREQFDAGGIEERVRQMRVIMAAAEVARLEVTASYLRELIGIFESAETTETGKRQLSGVPLEKAIYLLNKLASFLPDEAHTKLYFVVADGAKQLLEPPEPPFGNKVDEVFSVAIDDIRQAGRCLALGLGTAAVFHLMRVLEAGLKAIGSEIGVDYAPSWESYERKLKNILDSSNYPNLTRSQKAKRPFYTTALEDINTIKMVWRNPTMHIVKSYDAEQARLIYGAVKNFMMHLADNVKPVRPFVVSTGQVPS